MKPNFWKKIFGGPNVGPTGLNQAQNEVLGHFLEFAYNDRGKAHEKIFVGPNLGQTGQNRVQNYVFRLFLKLSSLFSL